MNERRNGLEIVKGRAIACTIQLGSISSLRCQKSRTPHPVKDDACEVMFRGRYSLRSGALAIVRSARLRLRRTSRAEAGAASEGWWSQTGSNRRPHACKARALPAELWPRTRRRMLLGTPSSRQPARFARWATAAFTRCASEGWWAWEDLNFRPHAYQARALTN